MSELLESMPMLLVSVAVSYMLGAIPLADQLSKRHGIDIFSVGTGLAGSTNVRKTVGKLPGLMVLVGDIAKGSLAVIISREIFGVSDPWILLPAGAAILGHWASIFSGLRGGDGLATLGGATLALFPILGSISILIGMLIQLGGQKLPYSSLLGVVAAYGSLAALVIVNEGDRTLVIGIGGLAGLVLSWALRGHKRRRHESDWEQAEKTTVPQDQSNRH